MKADMPLNKETKPNYIPQIYKAGDLLSVSLMMCPRHSLEVGVLPIGRDPVVVFCSPSQQVTSLKNKSFQLELCKPRLSNDIIIIQFNSLN